MKQITIILFVLLQAFYSYGQVVNFKHLSFDLSKLDYKNEYRESRYDSVYLPDQQDYELRSYGMSIYSSRNHEYFLIVKDTIDLALIRKTIGCDAPPKTNFYYYHKDTLLWGKYMDNGINGVHFFENDGSVIIGWRSVWVDDNYQLFYDRQGNVFDTLSIDEEIYDLDNYLKLISYYIEPSEGNGGMFRIKCVNSNNKELWKDEVNLKPKEYMHMSVSGNGSKFIIESMDTTFSFNSNHKLLWKKSKSDCKTHKYFTFKGNYLIYSNYIVKNGDKHIFDANTFIYDNQTGNLIAKIDSINYNNKTLIPISTKTVKNSDYLYFMTYPWLDKTDIIITDVKGNTLTYKEDSKSPDYIEYKNDGFYLYSNEKGLLEKMKYKP